MVHRCAADGSYMSASDLRVHFGLGKSDKPVTVSVKWRNGKTETYANTPIDRIVILKQTK